MILKVEGNESNWVFIGEVEEISHRTIICETREGFDQLREKAQIHAKDYTDARPWGNNMPSKKVQWISYIRKGHEEEYLLCDGEVYLLSEQGKTIERL